MTNRKQRCHWAGTDPLMIQYHDKEWGVPLHNERKLFEMLTLEGAQAGLSWQTILRKRQNYRKAFDWFDPALVARYDARKIRSLLRDVGIVRNRSKILATVQNARAFLVIKRDFGSFNRYIWRFAEGMPRSRSPRTTCDIPSQTSESLAMSLDLKRHGFTFVGPTICYAFMQAVGMVNDHVVGCRCNRALRKKR